MSGTEEHGADPDSDTCSTCSCTCSGVEPDIIIYNTLFEGSNRSGMGKGGIRVPKNDGVEIIANDQRSHTTHSYVAVVDSERLIRDAAKNQVARNPGK